jgi:ADP-ribose pyrophosphatase YjhB (NUDIX family)
VTEQATLRDGWGNLAVTLSCQAIIMDNGLTWLRQNERGNWKLPGGRLDESKQPEDTIKRALRKL